jgi:hypothetical protein
VTDQAEPGRPPAHDLAAFDLAKRSPEQLAQSFAQWKARRRPPQATANAATPAPKPPPAAADKAEKSTAPDTRAVAPRRGWATRSIPVQYSDTFSTLLAAGSEPAVQRIAPPIVVARPSPRRSVSPGRRLKAMTILAGAASLATLAGGALLELSNWRDAEPKSAQIQPAAVPITRAATDVRTVAWTLKPMVDRALLKAAMPPAVQTASKSDASSAKPAPAQPAFKKAAPEITQFVAKPFIPNAAPAPQPFPAAPARASIQTAPLATGIHAGDPRPDALFQHGRNQGDAAFSSRLASGGKPAATSKSNSAAQAPTAARTGKTASAGSGDPRGESSGGAQSDAGTEADGAVDAGAGNGSGSSNGGSASGDGNDGGADTGGSDDSGGDAGGSDGADSGQPDAGDSVGGGSGAGPADGASGGDSSPENADSDQGN